MTRATVIDIDRVGVMSSTLPFKPRRFQSRCAPFLSAGPAEPGGRSTVKPVEEAHAVDERRSEQENVCAARLRHAADHAQARSVASIGLLAPPSRAAVLQDGAL